MQIKFTVLKSPSGEFIKYIFAPSATIAAEKLLNGKVVQFCPKWALVQVEKEFVELCW